jgi:hypothetical protein
MTTEAEQLLLPLLIAVPADKAERRFVRLRQEVVAERLRVLGLPIKEEAK